MNLATKLAALAAAALLCAGQANAGLQGSTATFQYYAYGGPFSYPGSYNVFTVDGSTQVHFGMDQQFIGTYFEATIRDNEIEIEYQQDVLWSYSPASYSNGNVAIANGALFSFAGAQDIVSATLNPTSTAVAGLSNANVTFNANEVGISWAGLSFHNGDRIVLDIATATRTAPVPEPETAAMMLAGLSLLAWRTARRRG